MPEEAMKFKHKLSMGFSHPMLVFVMMPIDGIRSELVSKTMTRLGHKYTCIISNK